MARGGFFAVDSLSSVHVMVVEEEDAFRDVLVSLLRYCGALVTAVSGTDEALGVMDHVKPDVIVVTLAGAPRATAFVVHVRARKPEDGGVLPIVAVVRDAATLLPEGVTAHLFEPLNPWELCRVISSLVSVT